MKKISMMMLALTPVLAFGAIRAMTPTAWNGDPNCWQMKRHNEKMKLVAAGGAKVVFVGDSITHFWEDRGQEQLRKYFSEGDYKMLDLGISGDRTEHVLWRLTEGKELDGYAAKVVLLMIGTNNTGHFSMTDEPPIDTILGIHKILQTIREKQPTAKIVLTAIFPRGATMNDPLRRRNEIVNREIAKFADGKMIFWCDFNDQLLTVDGELPRGIFPDLLHPNGYGYEVWAAAVKPYIDYALSDGKLPAPPNRYAAVARKELFRMNEPYAVSPESRIINGGPKDFWFNRMLEKRNQVAEAKGEIDIVFFGDSITHNWDHERAGRPVLDELTKTYSILNLGYSADRTENLIWRGQNGELDGYKAKCVMLMIGTNNTWHRFDKPEQTAEGIRQVLEVVKAKQPQAKILLLPIFPFGDSAAHKNRVNNERVNALIEKFADGQRVIWVDLRPKFLDEKGDTIKLMPDRCHPNLAGYRDVWMPAVLPYFKEICGK